MKMYGKNEKTVQWCVDNLLKSSSVRVDWAALKADALNYDNQVAVRLIEEIEPTI
jgi:hypothetical protein